MVGGFLHLGLEVCRGVFCDQKTAFDIEAGPAFLGGGNRADHIAATWRDFQILWADAIPRGIVPLDKEF